MDYQSIKILCRNSNKTELELIDYLGYTSAGFYKMLKNKTLSVSTLEKISEFFNVSPCYFVDPEYKSIDKNDSELVDLLRFKIKVLEDQLKTK